MYSWLSLYWLSELFSTAPYNIDPSIIEDPTKLFSKAMEAMEEKEAEKAMQEGEDYLHSVMETAMDEFRKFEDEMERMLMAENSLQKKAKRMGNSMEKAANFASKKSAMEGPSFRSNAHP
ncbi:Maternal effect embryo arrest 9 [Gossypium australe]|uniref:Maternal effect embryo arrest 9 n=1 Tax=Gossypium australe TaxID=47621 RepID=A0A5B6V2A0_9ROSI|nr:Maternal effect embryo arrest 9 [Gossypium australe]